MRLSGRNGFRLIIYIKAICFLLCSFTVWGKKSWEYLYERARIQAKKIIISMLLKLLQLEVVHKWSRPEWGEGYSIIFSFFCFFLTKVHCFFLTRRESSFLGLRSMWVIPLYYNFNILATKSFVKVIKKCFSLPY